MRPLPFLLALGTASLLLGPAVARANPEPPAIYDARVMGMGGTALGTLDNASALFHNPAQLDRVNRLSVTGVVTGLTVRLTGSFAGRGSEQESPLIFAPLIFAGGVVRVHDRVVLGGGAYIYTGFGGGFDRVDCVTAGLTQSCDETPALRLDPPRSQTVRLFVAEFAVPVQVSIIPDRLSLGVTFRLPYGNQSVSTDTLSPFSPEELTRADQNVAGVGIPGILAGLSYRPTDDLTLAVAYRSKVWIDMDGETTTDIPLGFGFGPRATLATKTRWYVPHMLRVGFAQEFWNDRITLAGEFRVQFHEEANREQAFTLTSRDPNQTVRTTLNNSVPDTVARFDWRNVYLGNVGLEVLATDYLPVRLGFSLASSASNPATMTAFSPPFGVQAAYYAGLGYRADKYTLDLGFSFSTGNDATNAEDGALCTPGTTNGDGTLTPTAGCSGTFDAVSYFLSVSASYNL
ncbi:MAG: outer membrane protein transport protein [Myxococcota bacterium]